MLLWSRGLGCGLSGERWGSSRAASRSLQRLVVRRPAALVGARGEGAGGLDGIGDNAQQLWDALGERIYILAAQGQRRRSQEVYARGRGER